MIKPKTKKKIIIFGYDLFIKGKTEKHKLSIPIECTCKKEIDAVRKELAKENKIEVKNVMLRFKE